MPKLLDRNDNLDRMIREKATHERHTGKKCEIKYNSKFNTWELRLTDEFLKEESEKL